MIKVLVSCADQTCDEGEVLCRKVGLEGRCLAERLVGERGSTESAHEDLPQQPLTHAQSHCDLPGLYMFV